jgi:predicted glycosyltransferase
MTASTGGGGGRGPVLTVDYRIKVHMDLQADKSTVVVKGPFFPRVVNPRYRIRGTMCNARIQSSKARKAIL